MHFERGFMCSYCNGSSLVQVHYEEHEMARGYFHANSTNFMFTNLVEVEAFFQSAYQLHVFMTSSILFSV